MSTNEVKKHPLVNDFPDLPILTEATLEPSLLGPNAYMKYLAQILTWLPNRDVFIKRRRRETKAIAPVRFQM